MGWRRYFRRVRWDRDRREEIESYIQIETDDNIARGMPEEEARLAARRKFGNATRVREEIYRMNTVAFIDTFVRDMRYALRALRQNRAFTAAALLTLALGIGANTAVFSVVNSVLLRPLPYPHSEELVAVRHVAPGAAGLSVASGDLGVSPPMYFTYAEQNRTFQALGVWAVSTQTVTGLAEPEQARVAAISNGVLEALSVQPVLGRWIGPSDQAPAAPQTVMLSYGYWQRHFGGDRSLIGRSIRLDSLPREAVGVMPQGFKIVNADPDLIAPFAFDRGRVRLPGYPYECIGRLKPGVTIPQADADIARMVPVWIHSWPAPPGALLKTWETAWRITPALQPLKQDVVGNVGEILWVVMGAIARVMLIACANVANLLLVRAEARRQELAIRAALGAGWRQIAGELLTESVLLGLMGGILGAALAYEGLRFLVALGPANLPRLNEISLDGRTLAFTFALSILSGLLFGSLPAFKYAGGRIALGGRTLTVSRDRQRTRNALVVAQVALALVLLIGSGLMTRTFYALHNVDPGFTHPEQLQTMRLYIPTSLVREPEQVTRLQNDILDNLAAIPGVISAGFASAMPMEGIPDSRISHGPPTADAIYAEDKTYDPAQIPPLRLIKRVSPGFFRTAGARIVAGRKLTWNEVYGHRRVVVVSENLARELWGAPAAALGKRIREFPGMPWVEVIGVVQDIRENGVHEKAPAIVYWPSMFEMSSPASRSALCTVTFVIRSDRTGGDVFLKQIRQAVRSVNSNLAVASVRTMREIYDRSLARTSFTLVMLAIAGGMALALGIVGICGVLSYAVSQRRREIGVRLALGAQQGELLHMFVRHGLVLASAGVTIGLIAAVGLTRMLASLLFGIGPFDPLAFASAAAVSVLAGGLASFLPARRATAVDPVEVLKAE
jgi:predicted permease